VGQKLCLVFVLKIATPAIASLLLALLLGGCASAPTSAKDARPTGVSAASPSAAPAGQPTWVALAPGFGASELCRNAIDDNNNQLIDEGCNEAQGDIFVALAWNEPRAKLDLLVLDPGGDLAPVGRSSLLGLVRSRDCPGSDRECEGVNYESVVLEGEEPLSGTLTVRVRYEGSEPASDVVRAQLGVRVSGRSQAFALSFSRVGTELVLSFDLEPKP